MSQIKNSESRKGKERSDKGIPIKLLVDSQQKLVSPGVN